MFHLTGAFGLLRRLCARDTRWVAAIGLALSAFAPTSAMACAGHQIFEPERFLELYTREEIVSQSEVILEGVIEPSDPAEYGLRLDDHLGIAVMHVDRVWKGDVGSAVAILYSTESADCSHPPPFGERIRFGASLAESSTALHAGVLPFWGDQGELVYGFDAYKIVYSGIPKPSLQRAALLRQNKYLVYYTGTMNVPLREPQLDALLDSYRGDTHAIAEQASGSSKDALLAYARYLAKNNESQRALEVYERTLRLFPNDLDLLLNLAVARGRANAENEPEDTLAAVKRLAPDTDEWRGKIARTRFAATGKFTDGWKDWSDLERPTFRCMSHHQKFDHAIFDRADFSRCMFFGADFTEASFLGADLSGADFKDSIFTGARYDCATKFPDDLDRVALGMIYVEGSCQQP